MNNNLFAAATSGCALGFYLVLRYGLMIVLGAMIIGCGGDLTVKGYCSSQCTRLIQCAIAVDGFEPTESTADSCELSCREVVEQQVDPDLQDADSYLQSLTCRQAIDLLWPRGV